MHETLNRCSSCACCDLFAFPLLTIVVAVVVSAAAVHWRRIATNECLDFVLLKLKSLVEAHSDIVDKDTLGDLSDGQLCVVVSLMER